MVTTCDPAPEGRKRRKKGEGRRENGEGIKEGDIMSGEGK
jgi:hypothetical protein